MKITLHQLSVFKLVAEFESVTSAASALHMTQPAVSNIIKQLEQYYAIKLFDHVGRRIVLTAFGRMLAEQCLKIEGILKNTMSEMEILKGGMRGELQVATVSTAKYFMPKLLGQFKQQFPGVHIKLAVDNRQAIVHRLEQHVDDFVIMSHPPRSIAVDYAHFFDDELVIARAAKSKHRFPAHCRLSDLSSAAWIRRELGSGTRFATEHLFKQKKFHPNIEMEISDIEAIKQAIMADIGVSVISKASIELEVKNKLIKTMDVVGFPVKHQWYLVKNRGKSLSPIAEHFYQFVNQHQPKFKG